MRVIKDKRIQEDGWIRISAVEANQELPAGDIILPYPYWKEHREPLSSRSGQVAVCLNGEDRVEEVAEHLDRFRHIALEFPVFKDGRCYSHARLLRDRYGFEGDLRAVGDVLRDQLFYMRRCGISSFQVREDKDIEDALNAFNDFSVRYQAASDDAVPIYRLR